MYTTGVIVEEDGFSTIVIQLAWTNLNTKKAAHAIVKRQCCEIRKHPYWKCFFMHSCGSHRVNKFHCVN